MPTERSRRVPGASIVLAMFAMVAVPAAITLRTVREPARISISTNPTPHGYTWSLLLFLIPIIVIAGWLLPREGLDVPKRAFWRIPIVAMLWPKARGASSDARQAITDCLQKLFGQPA